MAFRGSREAKMMLVQFFSFKPGPSGEIISSFVEQYTALVILIYSNPAEKQV